MADLIDFPLRQVDDDASPAPGDAYQAFGLARHIQPVCLTFVLPDWSRVSCPYLRLHRLSYQPLDPADAPEGAGTLRFRFDGRPGLVDTVVHVTGRRLLPLCTALGAQQVHWLWQCPARWRLAVGEPPVVLAIEIRSTSRAGNEDRPVAG